jgi:hypothetical protein
LRKLVAFGLSNLSSSCVDWFTPAIDIAFLPWIDDAVEAIKEAKKTRQALFEVGDGVNVYAEPVLQTR